MKSQDIARRYGRALFSLAAEENALKRCRQELRFFVEFLEEQKELKNLLTNPAFSPKEKGDVLGEVVEKLSLSSLVVNILLFLNEKKRLALIEEIEAYFVRLVEEALGMVMVTVKVPQPLKEELVQNWERDLSMLTGRQVKANIVIDPSLLGGMILEMDDRIYDASLKSNLRRLEQDILASL